MNLSKLKKEKENFESFLIKLKMYKIKGSFQDYKF
jgi:hypothetical protein